MYSEWTNPNLILDIKMDFHFLTAEHLVGMVALLLYLISSKRCIHHYKQIFFLIVDKPTDACSNQTSLKYGNGEELPPGIL